MTTLDIQQQIDDQWPNTVVPGNTTLIRFLPASDNIMLPALPGDFPTCNNNTFSPQPPVHVLPVNYTPPSAECTTTVKLRYQKITPPLPDESGDAQLMLRPG